MRVGVIGPPDLVHLCVEAGHEHRGVQFVPLPYTDETQAVQLFEDNRAHVDVFLFTGIWPYHRILEKYKTDELGIPMVRIASNFGSIIYKILTAMLANGIDPRHISIDGLSHQEVTEIYQAVSLDARDVKALPGDRPIPREVLINFHLSLWRQGKTKAALTYMRTVHEALLREGVPAFRGMPEQAAIRAGVARAALEAQSLKAVETQIVVGLVCIDQSRRPFRSTYEGQRIKTKVYQELLEFGEEMGASVVPSESECFALFSTRGSLINVTKNYTLMPLLRRVQEKVSATVSVGFGIAPSANLSHINAEAALHMCKEQGGNTAFVVYHDGRVIGPLKNGIPSELHSLRPVCDPKHSRIASIAGLSVSTISKIAGVVKKNGSNRITASQLASELGIAERNGRRILMHLVNAGAAQVEGLEAPEAKGRPRKIYTVNL